ncbi:MAG: ABC transporter permease [Spirochaetota bacterium]
MLIWKLALRNLFRQRRRTLFTGLSMFVGFVMAGFFIGWADGTYNHMIDSFTRSRLGHIQIHQEDYRDKPSLYKTIGNPERVGELLEKFEEVEAWATRIYSGALVSVDDKSAGAEIIGIEIKREHETTSFSDKIVEGRYFSGFTALNSHDPDDDKATGSAVSAEESKRGTAAKEAILGKQLAEILKGKIGDEIAVFSQAADGSIAEDLFTIVGWADLGDPALNRSAVYIPTNEAQDFLVLPDQAHEIVVVLHDLRKTQAVAQQVQQDLDREFSEASLNASPWQEHAAEFYRAMQADKKGMYIALVVVVVIAAITILNTILMSVMERQKEYGVLKAIGTRPGDIVKMVVAETSLLALFAICTGAIVTFLLNSYMAQQGIQLNTPIEWGGMQLEYMRGEVNLRSFIIPSVTVLCTALVVCIVPALKAARTEPAKTMRSI